MTQAGSANLGLYEVLCLSRRKVYALVFAQQLCRSSLWVGLVCLPIMYFRAELGLPGAGVFTAYLIFSAIVAAALAWLKHIQLKQVVGKLDLSADKHDQVSSATEFLADPDPFKRLALHKTEQWLATNADQIRCLWKWPRETPLTVAVFVALLAVWWLTPPASASAHRPAGTPQPGGAQSQPATQSQPASQGQSSRQSQPASQGQSASQSQPASDGQPSPTPSDKSTSALASGQAGRQEKTNTNSGQAPGQQGGQQPGQPGQSGTGQTPGQQPGQTPAGNGQAAGQKSGQNGTGEQPGRPGGQGTPGGAGVAAAAGQQLGQPNVAGSSAGTGHAPSPGSPARRIDGPYAKIDVAGKGKSGEGKSPEKIVDGNMDDTDAASRPASGPALPDVEYEHLLTSGNELESLPPGRRALVIRYFRSLRNPAGPSSQPASQENTN